MKIGSINIRGMGAGIKKKIRSFVTSERLEFLVIQETKLEMVDSALCLQLWGSIDYNWSFSLVIGRSGRILSIWD